MFMTNQRNRCQTATRPRDPSTPKSAVDVCCVRTPLASSTLGSLRKHLPVHNRSIFHVLMTGKSNRNDDYWTTGNGRQNLSHFVPYEILTVANKNRPGPDYGQDTMREIQRIADSNYNTSETSGWWNQKTNRDAEREIKQYAEGKIQY